MEDYAPHTYFLERLISRTTRLLGKVWVYLSIFIEITVTIFYVSLCMYITYLFYMAPKP